MNIQVQISDQLVESIVNSIMQNFPEASAGSTLTCIRWKYEAWDFTFADEETSVIHRLDKPKLLAAFPLMFTDKWPKNCTQPPITDSDDDWGNWLCQADAMDFDAFVQLACLGEVIYG